MHALECSVNAPNSYKKGFKLTHESGREVQCEEDGIKNKPYKVRLSKMCLLQCAHLRCSVPISS